jgi:2-polyprenyl-3-methyl-5-hydroxy-6-metoxy-1,4-benzoquinol methylase
MPEDDLRVEIEPIPIAEIEKALRYKHDAQIDDLAAEYADYSGLPFEEIRKMLKTNGSEPHFPDGLFDEEDEFLISLLQADVALPHLRGRTQLALSVARTLPLETFLDYGAGLGRDCIAFARFGYDCFHADLLGRQTEFAAWRYQVRDLKVEIGDVRELPDRKFDAVSCYDVLEHVPDPVGLLADLAWHVAPGGVLFIAVDLYNLQPPHLVKNSVYGPVWREILETAGLTFAGGNPSPVLAAAAGDMQIYHKDEGRRDPTTQKLAAKCFETALRLLGEQRDIHNHEMEMIRATLEYLQGLKARSR